MKIGKLDGAFWCITLFSEFSYWVGDNLSVLEADFTTYIRQMKEFDAMKAFYFLKFTRYIIADESEEGVAFAWKKGSAGLRAS